MAVDVEHWTQTAVKAIDLYISKEVYNKVDQNKFLPVAREADEHGRPYLPVFLSTLIYFDFVNPDRFLSEYDRLLRRIFKRPEYEKPQLGTVPAHLFTEVPLPAKEKHKLDRLKQAILEQKPFAPALMEDFLESMNESLSGFRIKDTKGSGEVDDLVTESIGLFLPYRDCFAEFAAFVARHAPKEAYEPLVHFSEKALILTDDGASTFSINNFVFIVRELFTYVCTFRKSPCSRHQPEQAVEQALGFWRQLLAFGSCLNFSADAVAA